MISDMGFEPLDKSSEIQSKEIGEVLSSDVRAAEIDPNCNAASFLSPLDTKDRASKYMSGFDDDWLVNSRIQEQTADIRLDKLKPGSVLPNVQCGSSPEATSHGNEQGNCDFLKSSCNDETISMVSDADESTIERSPSAIADDDASSDGPSSANCFSGCNMDDGRMEIVLYADYINYRGVHYVDSMVTFSRSSVIVKSKTVNGNPGTFHIQVEVEDIIKIESQWSDRYEFGSISVHFISNNAVGDEIDNNTSVPGIQELNFPAVDSNWYEKQEAIGSLNVRYKELWKVLLNVEIEDCTEATREEKALLLSRSYFPNFHGSFQEVIYPKGDPDAVSMSLRDIDLLRPDTFLNDTIIDFYIKYLKNKQNPDERLRFHFFNSFFFRKLADMDKDPSSAFDGKAAFQRVQKWTRKVNLLDKDFIVIPVNYNYHWSLIVICYFGKVADYEDLDANKLARVPCILHMDSIKGSHAGLKDLMQSYLWEEWKERRKETHEDLYSKFRNLKFISLELPQQQNSYDCGLFLLHYVELFLEEVPVDFSIHKITSLSNFLTADWFPPGEASIKRAHIERLIYDLCENHTGECSLSVGIDMHCYPNGTKTTNEYGNATHIVSEKSCPSKDCQESSLVGSEVEITLLPTSSSRSIQCANNTGLVLREFFEPGSASGLFSDAQSQAFKQRSSLNGLTRPIPPIQDEVEANGHFVYTTSTEVANQHLDVIRAEASLFPYSCGDFRLESIAQAALEDSDSSLAASVCDSDNFLEMKDAEKCQSAGDIYLDDKIQDPTCISPENLEHLADCFGSASGEMPNVAESRCHAQTSDHNDNAHSAISSSKNLQEIYQGNELLSDGGMNRECFTDCPASASGDILLDVSDSESPIRILDPNDHVDALELSLKNSPQSSHHDNDILLDDVGIGGHPVLESDMKRAAKRMRLEPVSLEEELTTNLSKDLPL
ncbi:unnamed protein product [Fraxinus pennsylvanica]|uniref:Ubiquitin-like protease family profile domain-containing protein n=1 Tax=Fraxinus pennsylvanica TaxID=56036 RepID=A0AAD2ADH7_9LAMI|nr:unnamed protein product [Fraxinus pennsylvanica]